MFTLFVLDSASNNRQATKNSNEPDTGFPPEYPNRATPLIFYLHLYVEM